MTWNSFYLNIYAVFFSGGGLLFWPIFQMIHRRWSLRAKRLFIVFLITLAVLAGYASLLIGPWKSDGVFAPFFWMPITNLVSLVISTLVCVANPTRPLPRLTRWVGIILAALTCLEMGYTRFIFDWRGQPVCHKNLMFACEAWAEEHTNAFPNAHGIGLDSLKELHDY